MVGIIIFPISEISFAQNLVPNPSFEDTIQCPKSVMNFWACRKWFEGSEHIYHSPDFYHTCANSVPNSLGYQIPKSGNAYLGIFTYQPNYPQGREFIESKLSDSLIKNKKYCISFYANKAEKMKYSSNIGAIITSDSFLLGEPYAPGIEPTIKNNVILNDTSNWQNISGIFLASGGEKFLTIGNFNKDENSNFQLEDDNVFFKSAYYRIDEVSVFLLEEKKLAGVDRKICIGDTAMLGLPPEDNYRYKWMNKQKDSIGNASFLSIKPAASTEYYLESIFDCECDTSIITLDTVMVEVIEQPMLPGQLVICSGGSIQPGVVPLQGIRYHWKPENLVSDANAANPFFTPGSSQFYYLNTYEVNNPLKCNFYDTVLVRVIPDADAGEDQRICLGDSVVIGSNPDGTEELSFKWEPTIWLSNPAVSNPWAYPEKDQVYRLTLRDKKDTALCLSSDEVKVSIKYCREKLIDSIPNVFTPNGDGINDVFMAEVYPFLKNFECTIFNRWGEEVYGWKGSGGGWAGKDHNGNSLSEGVYYYVLKIAGLQRQKITKTGFVQMIR